MLSHLMELYTSANITFGNFHPSVMLVESILKKMFRPHLQKKALYSNSEQEVHSSEQQFDKIMSTKGPRRLCGPLKHPFTGQFVHYFVHLINV